MQLSDQGEDHCLLHAQTQWSLGRVNDVPFKWAGRRPVESIRGLEGLLTRTPHSPHNSAGHRSSLHVLRGVVVTSLSGIITESARNAVPTFLLHTYPSTHPLLPPLSLASLITRPLTFSLTHSVTHPFTCFSFISPFSYTTWSSNTFNPLTNSNFTSYDMPVLASLINIPTLHRASRWLEGRRLTAPSSQGPWGSTRSSSLRHTNANPTPGIPSEWVKRFLPTLCGYADRWWGRGRRGAGPAFASFQTRCASGGHATHTLTPPRPLFGGLQHNPLTLWGALKGKPVVMLQKPAEVWGKGAGSRP